MGVTTEKYVRKPLYVDAVRVTAQNFDDVVAWCEGVVLTEEIAGRGITKKYINVAVENAKYDWQKKAFIGDWLLRTERDGKYSYKVYKSKAFSAAFDRASDVQDNSYVNVTHSTVGNGGVTGLQRAALAGGHPIDPDEVVAPQVQDTVSSPPMITNGKRVLTEAEQQEMDQDEVQGLLRSGDVILEQDLAGS